MGRRLQALGVVLSLFASVAGAETLTWEAAALRGPGREVLARGVKVYSPAKDVIVDETAARDGAKAWRKALPLNEDFALSVTVYRKPRLDGFGLVIHRRGDAHGFSWEWFRRGQGEVFQKLQGSGRVATTLTKVGELEELASVEFLDDIVLRYLDDMAKPPGTDTHEVTVRKGSVFRVAP